MLNENSNKVEVCHVTTVHSRYDVRIFHKECKSLANNGYDVTLIVNDCYNDEVIENVKIISTKFKYRNRIERIIHLTKLILQKALAVDADIYHLHDPELLPVGNKLKKRGKKVIFDSHENYKMQIKEKHYIPKLFRWSCSKLYNVYETYSVKNIDAVIFPCTFNYTNPFEGRAKKTVFINNVPMLGETYDKYDCNFPKDEKAICYIGGLTYTRGITHLIKAAYNADAKLILGGAFYPKEYENEVKNMEEFSCVDYRGYVDRDEVVDIYKRCNIGICNIFNLGQYNKSDNFATKVYEYMSMGLPVIISDYPYAREVLSQYKFGITVRPDNIDEITDAILYLFNNQKAANEMGQEGRQAIKEKFNWSIEEQKLFELYKYLED